MLEVRKPPGVALLTVRGAAVPVLELKFESPLYIAVMLVWEPTERLLTVKLVMPPDRLLVPRLVVPSKKVTVPVGVPVAGATGET